MALFGARIPREVKLLGKALNRMDRSMYEKIFAIVSSSLERNKDQHEMFSGIWSGMTESDKECVAVVTSGLLKLLGAVFKILDASLKQETLKSELSELKLPADVTNDVLQAVYSNNRSQIVSALTARCPRHLTLSQFHWRLDVSISTSSHSRVLEPTIMVEMILSDGTIKHFEMSMKVFHLLRCSVATVLKEMEDIEQRNVLKMLEQ